MEGNGSLYRVTPLAASTTPLIIGEVAGRTAEPVAWTNIPRAGKSRVFYTSLGHPADSGTGCSASYCSWPVLGLDIARPAAGLESGS